MRGLGLADESMSNLTSTISNETSISSSNAKNESSSTNNITTNNNNNNNNNNSMIYAHQVSSSSFASQQPDEVQPPPKKKRSLPGHPDPDAEVIALSPKSLLATNRFICEICNKGFQRDQNLQLHRRGHNLPWKLKQRANKDVIIKKVYVCPEPSCVHHHPSRALGDLTGIKKHFCRKHGEKKWNCDKCSKKYAVQSDWKAHSKICGTREYKCDCGTLFSRRDSFITHRAFCDALAQESSAINILNPQSITTLSSLTHHQPTMLATSTTPTPTPHISLLPHSFTSHLSFPMKREQVDQHPCNNNDLMDSFTRHDDHLPPWLACPPPSSHDRTHHVGQGLFSSFQAQYNHNHNHNHNQNYQQGSPTLHVGPTLSSFQLPLPSQPHLSATALLQRAAEMGVTVSHLQQQHDQQQQPSQQYNGYIIDDSNGQMTAGLASPPSSSSREDEHHYQAQVMSASVGLAPSSSMMLHGNVSNNMVTMMNNNNVNPMQTTTASSTFDSSNFGDFHHQTPTLDGGGRSKGGSSGGGDQDEGMTRDFLSLRTFSHKDFLNMAAHGQMRSSSSTTFNQQQDQQNHPPW